MTTTKKAKKDGENGELAFKKWLDNQNLSYLYINQDVETFASLFKKDNSVKRPDFLVLFESIGMVAVDVKNYAEFDLYGAKGKTIPYEAELKKVLTFERLFRIPVWYAYTNNKKMDKWLWISALKAIECGEQAEHLIKQDLLFIENQHFTPVATNSDLGELWTARFASYKNIAQQN